MTMDAAELARWTRFAAKGGIGKCTATRDCVAERAEDLMFLKDDEIVVLMQLPDREGLYLGYCEGVVGRFQGIHVVFHSKLKRPVMTKRSSVNSSKSRATSPVVQSQSPMPPPDVYRHSPQASISQSISMHNDANMPPSMSFSSSSTTSESILATPPLYPPREPLHKFQNFDIPFVSSPPQEISSLPLIHSPPPTPPRVESPVTEPEPGPSSSSSSVRTSTSSFMDSRDPDASRFSPPPDESSRIAVASPVRTVSPSIMDSETETEMSPRAGSPREEDRASEQSELYSTTPPDESYGDDPSTRISVAMSDGEVGIGLSLLQDLVNGDDDDDWSSTHSRYSVRSTVEEESGNSTVDVDEMMNEGKIVEDERISPTPSSQSLAFPMASERRPSLAPSFASSASTRPSEDWGAADIYDDYRYSRYSMASKVSRFSHGSHPSHPSLHSISTVPPVPDSRPSMESPRASAERKQSMESEGSVYTQSSKISGNPSASSSSPITAVSPQSLLSVPMVAPLDLSKSKNGNRPTPLSLDQRSPLLHTNWGSPFPSPTPTSPGSFLTSSVNSPTFSTYGGAASALRQRIEIERPTPSPQPTVTDQERRGHDEVGEGQIVIEDDEEPHHRMFNDSVTDIHDSPSPTSTSPSPVVSPRSLPVFYIANRSPTPTFPDDASSSAHGDVPPSPMVPSAPPPYTSPLNTSVDYPLSSKPSSTTSPPSSPSATGPPTPHLRPSLSELRGAVPGQQGRRSLFLPHPNAPKAPESSPGPMYIRSPPLPQQQQQPTYQGPPQHQKQQGLHAIHVMQMLRARAMSAPGPGPGRIGTLYGKTEVDLASSMGPVLVWFSPDPPPKPPATAPPGSPLHGSGMLAPVPRRSATAGSPRDSVNTAGSVSPVLGPGLGGQQRGSATPSPVFAGGDRSVSVDQGGQGGQGAGGEVGPGGEAVDGAIPRANFFPKRGSSRPRSRSFSGFNSTLTEVTIPLQRSQEEGNKPLEIPSAQEVRHSIGSPTTSTFPSSSSAPSLSPGKGGSAPKMSPLRAAHAPSPLSLPHNTMMAVRPLAVKSPTSPLAQSTTPMSPTVASALVRPLQQLRQMASRSNLSNDNTSSNAAVTRSPPSRNLAEPTSPTSPTMVLNHQRSIDSYRPPPASAPVDGRIPGPTHTRDPTRETMSPAPESDRPSVDTDAVSIISSRSQLVSPAPLGRQLSLRTKLSLPNLRRNRSRQDETSSLGSGSQGPDGETMQVQDMDFELVRPTFAQLQSSARQSEDSVVLGKEISMPLDLRPEHNATLLRMDSPAVSTSSGVASVSPQRSPTVATEFAGSAPGTSPVAVAWQPQTTHMKVTETESSMDAHRQREQKWMALMATVPAAQARKNKKVKKLLLDGVPSSVRYLVWSHLTDGKPRGKPGIYAQLGKRGRVPAFGDIERDVQRCFADHPQLQSTQGPLLSLLQAYLTMVPDVQYSTGLTLVAGQLLLLAPEEDAFWIFVSVMDTHIRPYFSTNTTQMEVDAALFSRALEGNDSQVAKKILVDMGISPSAICLPWFSSLFVGSLPMEYLHRVWDLFLYEGVPFLIRVGLAIISCCRRQILESTSEDVLLGYLNRPRPNWLPAPDSFASLVYSFKLKDDDVRKQRVKMEAQVKRQTQNPRTIPSAPGSISLPRT